MGAIGSLGQLYMFILLVLLFMGSGFALWSFIKHIIKINKSIVKTADSQKFSFSENKGKRILGGFYMLNNRWFKLVVFSFVGIIISVAILSFTTSYGMQSNLNNMQMQGNMQLQSNMPMQSNSYGNMPMQNYSYGNMPMQSNSYGNMPMQNDYAMMMQQLNQMQQQINLMQQQMNQMNQMNSNAGSGSSSMNSSGGMNMM